jgi:hypothetical protein
LAYQSGDTILDTHYNGFASDINAIWGTGSGDSGYGQTSTLATVSDGTTITATQWATMLNRIKSISNHQGSNASITMDTVTNPVVGDTITAYTTLSADISTLNTNRLNAAANGTDIMNNLDSVGSWTTQTLHTLTFTWGSADQARYFFNAGGQLLFSFSRTGGTAHTKNTEWSDLCTQTGTLTIGATSFSKTGGSGTPSTLATGIGFYDLSTTNQTLFQQEADTAPYTANYLRLQARTALSGRQVVVEVTFRDDAADTFDDTVDGTLRTTDTVRPPSTTYLADTWGTVSRGTSQSQS